MLAPNDKQKQLNSVHAKNTDKLLLRENKRIYGWNTTNSAQSFSSLYSTLAVPSPKLFDDKQRIYAQIMTLSSNFRNGKSKTKRSQSNMQPVASNQMFNQSISNPKDSI